MANWIKCTRASDGGAVLINLDQISTLAEVKKDGKVRGTAILIAGQALDLIVIDQLADIVKRGGIKHA